jgi:hypothetical protein
MAVQIATVAKSISEIDVANLAIKDTKDIPVYVSPRGAVLLPKPDFLTDVELIRDSTGEGDWALQTLRYTLNYRLCYAPIGAYRNNVLAWVSDVTVMAGYVIDAVILNDTITGCVDIRPRDVINMGIVNDPSEKEYYGCDFQFEVMEFVN